MYKAYLAHSHEDKSYVEIVARKLTRVRVVYDVNNFPPGKDFRDSIREGLNKSALFVLFASANSLSSTWVRFEIDEAELRKIEGKLQSTLVFLIDKAISHRDLPLWMRRARVITQPRPTQAARTILTHLIYEMGLEKPPLFVGREELMKEVVQGIIPSGGSRSPQVIVASGLDGVGRRSVLQRVFRDNLSLDFGPVVRLQATDGLDRLYMLLVDETRELSTRDEMAEILKRFSQSSPRERAKLIVHELESIAKDNVATVVVDEGSLLDEDGKYRDDVVPVFESLAESKREPYLVLIQRRRPLTETAKFGDCKIATFVVPPLDRESTKRLLLQSLKSVGITEGSVEEIDELANYLHGYPPAVNLAVSLARRYGFRTVLADKSMLVDFKFRRFSKIIEKLGLSEEDQLLARVLGIKPAITLDVLSVMTGFGVDAIAPRIRNLIDNSLVLHEAGRFSLAAPIRDTIYRTFGLLTPTDYARLATRLKEQYWQKPGTVPTLDVIDATIYSISRGSKENFKEFADIALPSMLLKVANDAYHARDWRTAREFAERALSANASLQQSLTILCKSYVRLAHDGIESWEKAEAVVKDAETKRIKGHHYLRGFLEWKRGNLEEAVRAYFNAENAGDRGVGIYRDRAHCLFQLDRFDEAEKDIEKARERFPRNNYIVDLAAEIAIRKGRFEEAERLIDELEYIDTLENYYHRRSMLYAARRQYEAALADTEIACRRVPPLHEILANRVDILIELGRFADAHTQIQDLSKQFGGPRHRDVQIGLLCKLSLRQHDWREAESFYKKLHAKHLRVHRGLRLEILRQKIEDPDITPEDRKAAEEELGALESEAKGEKS